MLRVAPILIAAVLLTASAARADTTLSDLGNLHPSADAQLAAETQLAVDFWRARNVTACPGGISVWLADFPDWQTESGLDCAVYMDAWTIAKRRVDARLYQVDNEGECALVVHGAGHAMGLEHTATGVMAPMAEAPWECQKFAGDLARRDRQLAKRSPACRGKHRAKRMACRSRA